MRNLLKLSLIAAVASIQLSAVEVKKTEEVEKKLTPIEEFKKMNKHFEGLEVFKSMNATIVSNKQIGDTGMYMIKGKQNSGALLKIISDVSGQYVVVVDQRGQSRVVDVKNKVAQSTPYDVTLIKSKKPALTYGNGTKNLYVFTDPECPACKEFEKQWKNLKDEYKLNVYFYNLDFHKEANSMSKYIMAAKTNDERVARLIDIANGNTDYKTVKISEEDEKSAAVHIITGKEIGDKIILEGTPTIVDEDGNGIVNWSELLKFGPQPSKVETEKK